MMMSSLVTKTLAAMYPAGALSRRAAIKLSLTAKAHSSSCRAANHRLSAPMPTKYGSAKGSGQDPA